MTVEHRMCSFSIVLGVELSYRNRCEESESSQPSEWTRRIVRFFALKSGKWSMADVLVVALFMTHIGFDGVISTQLNQLKQAAAGMNVLTTNNTRLEAGFFLFLGFCIAGMLLGMALERSSRKSASPRGNKLR